jgi:3-hydroxyacyl-CoA dehydrogenase
MMLGGATVTAADAEKLGLIDKVIEGDPIEAGLTYARELLAAGAKPRPTSALPVDTAGWDDTGIAKILDGNRKALKGRTTQDAFVRAVEAATALPFEQGLDLEHGLAMDAVATAESRALRHAFFAERATSKIPGIAKGEAPLAISSVAVIGAGTMGSGIAMAFSNAGFKVTLVDAKSEGLERGTATIRSTYEASAKRGRMSEQVAADHVARIRPTLALADIANADLVVEAVFEDMALKKRVLADIDRVASPHAIIATNTSSLSVDELAAATSRPDKVIGLHFFSPAHVMRLLEIVRGERTSSQTLLTGMEIAKRIRKIGVVSGDGFGFIGNRMMLDGYFREAEQLLLEGARPEQVDAVMEKFGFAMGPFRVTDMGGVDIGTLVRQQLFLREERQDPYFAVSDKLTALGWLGQKAGRGFYSYKEDPRAAVPDPELTGIIADLATERGIDRRDIPDAEIEERCVLQLVNIGADILAEGIAYRASDIDVVWLAGYGFPRHLGGPMCYADILGLPHVLARIRHYHERLGHYWTPSPRLIDLVARGLNFAGTSQLGQIV